MEQTGRIHSENRSTSLRIVRNWPDRNGIGPIFVEYLRNTMRIEHFHRKFATNAENQPDLQWKSTKIGSETDQIASKMRWIFTQNSIFLFKFNFHCTIQLFIQSNSQILPSEEEVPWNERANCLYSSNLDHDLGPLQTLWMGNWVRMLFWPWFFSSGCTPLLGHFFPSSRSSDVLFQVGWITANDLIEGFHWVSSDVASDDVLVLLLGLGHNQMLCQLDSTRLKLFMLDRGVFDDVHLRLPHRFERNETVRGGHLHFRVHRAAVHPALLLLENRR